MLHSSRLANRGFHNPKKQSPIQERRELDFSDIDLTLLIRETRNNRPFGFLCDIGAPKSVIGKKELNRILTHHRMYKKQIRPSLNSFRFADVSFNSLGSISIPLATPPGAKRVLVELDIVNADIPPLLGLDILDREELNADTAFNRLAHRSAFPLENGKNIYIDNWFVPITRSSSRHCYVPMDLGTSMYFTKAQLTKLHRQFFHPSASKLFNLLKKARPEKSTPETLKILMDISKRCDPCQRIRPAPTRFRVAFGAENVCFNERILIDIMYIDSRPVLHIVDEGTRFSSARFLPSQSTNSIWETMLKCWASIYTGLPNRIMVDQGSAFGKGEIFAAIAAQSNVKVETTGVEAHSSLGLGERYHQPLRSTYRKLILEHPTAPKDLLLHLSVKAMNDTLGPEGLVPSALVFGEYPQVRTRAELPAPRPDQVNRAAIAASARAEMTKHMAKLRVQRALRHATPSAADRSFNPGDQVLVWREKVVNNRIGEWLGPYTVDSFYPERKLVYVRDTRIGNARPFNISQVKRYFQAEDLSKSYFADLNSSLSHFRSQDDDSFSVYLTEIIRSTDSRANSNEMNEAKRKEIKGLLERGTFKIILREEVPPDANILPGRLLLAIKSTEDGKIKFKARYVIGGHRDKLKHMMVHNSATLQPQSIRLLLAIAVAHGFNIWTSDVTQAYLQSSVQLMRDIYITKPIAEFELDQSQCLQLLKPLYGLCEAGDLWYRTIDEHHRLDLGMTPLRSDPALYTLLTNGLLTGLSGGYVDDLLRAGDSDFHKLARKTNKRFQMGEDEILPCAFSGFLLSQEKDGSVLQNQTLYLKKLECLPIDAPYSDFRSMRMKLAWLSNTRPDCLFEISQLAQVTASRYTAERPILIRRLNRAIKFAVNNRIALKIPQLDKNSLKVVGFSDSSFANNHDLSTQLGHITFLTDCHGNAAPIHFKSYKSKRIVRSAMAGEVIAFSDLFDTAETLADELSKIYNRRVPVQLFTDSKSLFDVISKGSRTSEKRLMLDIAAAREGFRDKLISDIGFVRSNHNIADGLTKYMSQATLQRVISTGKLQVSTEQWIIRS